MIGRTLSHYRIVDKLGKGGMGEVYLAEDTKLDRKVALKVLPPEMASSERRERFEREAKAIAALDHPNIVTIHSVEESDGVRFITMELVKGTTLTELIPNNGFALEKFFVLAIPLADAVAAAHEEGITHRDLKPDNVMVTSDGRVKVLDFGLAKPLKGFTGSAASDLPTQAKTAEGAIVGTLAYMSPEQAQGKPLDARTDVFSLGIVLYEMLTGRRPFEGQNPAELLSSIIKDTPATMGAHVPRRLSRMVERCLAKNPVERYQSVLDLRHDLVEIREELQNVTRVVPRKPPWKWAVLAALAAAIVLVGRDPTFEPDLPRLMNPVQITSAAGVEDYPAWSPDGSTLAYTANEDIWVTQLEKGSPVNRTADFEGRDCCPSWSPDGAEIAFWSARDGGGYFVMSALGGRATKILAAPASSSQFNAPQWSDDGSELAGVVTAAAGAALHVYSLDSRATRNLPLPGSGGMRNHLEWSHDGRLVAVVDGGYYRDNHELWLMRVDDGRSFSLTDGRSRVLSPSFSSDGRHMYYVSNRNGSMDLWDQRLDREGGPEGNPAALTVGIGMLSAAFSPDGRKLAYSQGRRVSNLWRAPILLDRPARWSDAEPLTFDEALTEFFHVSEDGARVVFNSDRAGNMDLWVHDIASGETSQLTRGAALDWCPRWSPDGAEVAFYSLRTGGREIFVLPLDGGPLRQVTDGETQGVESWYPSWSPDAKEIAFARLEDETWSIQVVASVGGTPRRIQESPNELQPVWSRNGRFVYFAADGSLWRAPATGGEREHVAVGIGAWPIVSRDGESIFFQDSGRVWALSLRDGSKRALIELVGRPGSLRADLATDGGYLYFGWQEDLGDIWVMDVVR